MSANSHPITVRIVADNARPAFLPLLFGPHFLSFERAVYVMTALLCADYDGGYWDFHALSNGGMFIALQSDDKMRLCWHGNGFEGEASAEAAGIIACLFVLSDFAERTGMELYADLYRKLRDYACEHPEDVVIFRAID
jgi:hypothetical protein